MSQATGKWISFRFPGSQAGGSLHTMDQVQPDKQPTKLRKYVTRISQASLREIQATKHALLTAQCGTPSVWYKSYCTYKTRLLVEYRSEWKRGVRKNHDHRRMFGGISIYSHVSGIRF